MNKIPIVNQEDNILDFESKEKCHAGNGILHRAFSIFIFNDKKELLIQQRSKFKTLWPLYWSNSCCSHPKANENYGEAAERRLKEEIGISCKLRYLYKFRYQSQYKDIGVEKEICAVLIGKSNRSIIPNPQEISDYKWVDINELSRDMTQNPEKYTPWFKIEIKELLSSYKKEIYDLLGSNSDINLI
jgi:isopentenyl-diphosphate delta-isomerase